MLSGSVHTVIKNISQGWKGSGFGFVLLLLLLLLLLWSLFHADSVHHQFQVDQDVGLVAADGALDGFVGQQLGELACENPLALSLHGCSQAADVFGHLLGKGNDRVEVLLGDVAAIQATWSCERTSAQEPLAMTRNL